MLKVLFFQTVLHFDNSINYGDESEYVQVMLPSNVVSLAQCKLPFRQDMLRLATLRLVGASETRRAARFSSSCMADG